MVELNKIYNEDFFEGVRRIEDKTIDLIVTDPPYAFTQNSNWLLSEVDGKHSILGKSKCLASDKDIRQKMAEFGEERIFEFLDLVKPKMKRMNAYFFCSEEQVVYYGNWARANDLHFSIMVWEKPLSIINKNRFSTNVEYIVRIYEFGTALNRLEHHNDFYNKVAHTKVVINKKHPTQKPIDLIQRYILLSSNEGEVVLDPFMGSGTTALASHRCNRHYIGFELDEGYYRLALSRIDAEARQLSLF